MNKWNIYKENKYCSKILNEEKEQNEAGAPQIIRWAPPDTWHLTPATRHLDGWRFGQHGNRTPLLLLPRILPPSLLSLLSLLLVLCSYYSHLYLFPLLLARFSKVDERCCSYFRQYCLCASRPAGLDVLIAFRHSFISLFLAISSLSWSRARFLNVLILLALIRGKWTGSRVSVSRGSKQRTHQSLLGTVMVCC